MDCGHWSKLIPAYLDKELPRDQVQGLEEHLDSCPACARLADEAQRLGAALDAALAVELPWAVGRAARKAFKAEASSPGLASWWRGMSPALRSAACVLALAGLLAGVFMGNLMTSYIRTEPSQTLVTPVLSGEETELVL